MKTIDEMFEELILEASEENWDGYDSKPVNREAVENAKTILLALPPNIPLPDLAADSDGEVLFDWMGGRRSTTKYPGYRTRVTSCSINALGEVAWAAMCQEDKAHGLTSIEEFNLTVLPWVRRVMKDENSESKA